MDKAAKLILNSLKCPICKSQIDLVTWTKAGVRAPKNHNFGCVQDPYHYSICFIHWEGPPKIESEMVHVYSNNYLYTILQKYLGSEQQTKIFINEVDKEYRLLDTSKIKTFEYNKLLFNFSQSNEERIINRIKTILMFQ